MPREAVLNRQAAVVEFLSTYVLTCALVLGCLVGAIVALGTAAHAQSTPVAPPASLPKAPAPEPTPPPPAAPPKAPVPEPIPLAEIAAQAESASARVRDLLAELSSDRVTEDIASELPMLTREIEARLRETRKVVAQRPSLEILGSLESDWRPLRNDLSAWIRDLTSRATRLEREMVQIEELEKTWILTLGEARDSLAPPEVLRRVEGVIAAIKQAREAVTGQEGRILTVQNRVAVQDARIKGALSSIVQARDDALNRLFVKDGPAIWSAEVRAHSVRELLEDSQSSLSTQWTALRVYAERQTVRFLLHAALIILLTTGLYWAARRVRPLPAEEAGSVSVALVFGTPTAAGLLLSFLCARWIYPQAPGLLWAALGVLALAPSVIILRRLLGRDLHPMLYALAVLYLIDQVRTVVAAVEVLRRLLFLAEMLGATLFLPWLIRSKGPRATMEAARRDHAIKAAASVALVCTLVAFMANAMGYVTLANLLGNTLLGSAYLGPMLYAAVTALDGLLMIALGQRPLRALRIVRQHGPLLRRRIRHGLGGLAIVLWVVFGLERLFLRERLFETAREVLTAERGVGSLRISLGDVLAFGLTVWAAFLVSRFVRFLLDEDVYPRISLARGLPYAISTMLHYVILVVGLFAAVAALGLDMTRVTILAGAFSLGVGFGLQNVFNNFVSGLILLFERPLNVGDVVQVEDASGVVERIGIRASIIRTTNGSEVIIPNGKLISERLTNWTLSNRQHGIELPIAVAHGTDPSRVMALLEKTAAAHPLVTKDPPPQALVVRLGPDSLGIELRAWTDRSEQWMQIRSELAIAISTALAAEKIEIR